MPGEAEHDELVMTLVEAALERPARERESFVRSACAGNSALYDEVHALLEWEERMGSFLCEPLVTLPEMLDRPFEPGELLAGRFRILRQIAQGGMGVVYEAQDEKLDRRIAVKCARLGFDHRLPPEARAAREVSHYNVCKVHELHTVDTPHGEIEILTMEFVSGETLAARLRRAPLLAEPEIHDIVRQVCAGLGQAHRQGVIHGDLKPANILLSRGPDGSLRAVLTDFGLAKMYDAFGPHTMSDRGGTFPYMAPELREGERATGASDLYALGVVIHEMVSATVTNQENSSTKTTPATPPAPAGELPGLSPSEALPPLWASIIKRCTANAPGERYGSAEEILRDLQPQQVRPLISSRALAAVAALLVAVATWAGWSQWFSTSAVPVRLAIFPAAVEGSAAPAVNGVLYDLVPRLRGLRRGFVVLSPGELQQYHVESPGQAVKVLAATHAVRCRVEHRDGFLRVRAALVDATSGHTLRELEGSYADNDAGTLAQALLATVTGGLGLRSPNSYEPVTPAAYDDYVQGMALLRRDNDSAKEAIPYFERAAQIDSRSALPLAGLAEAQLLLYRSTHAGEWLDRTKESVAKAKSLNSDTAPVLLVDGELQRRSGRYELASQAFARASELEPDNPDAWLRLALSYELLNRPTEALATYRRAIEAQPRYFRVYLQLFTFHWNRAEYAQAESVIRQLVSFAPDLYPGHTNLGSVLMDEGRLAEAEAEFRESLRLRETPIATFMLGGVYYYQRRYSEAVVPLERVFALEQPIPDDFLVLGHVYRHMGRTEEARKLYQQGLQVAEAAIMKNPRSALTRSQLGLFAVLLGNRERATYEIAQALELAPGNDKLTGNAALTYDLLGNRDQAIALLARAPAALLGKLRQEPDFEEIERDPRFRALLKSTSRQEQP